MKSTSRGREAFTLVELLVVIAIIATIAALLVPTIFRALNAARVAAIKAEIDMLHTALMNYRSEFGELPPCIDTSYGSGTVEYKANGQAARHLQRLFPRCSDPAGQLNQLEERGPDPAFDTVWADKLRQTQQAGGSVPTRFGVVPNNAVNAWLTGFTPDPRNPLSPAPARVKLFDFDTSRRSDIGQYAPAKKPKSPYIYIDAANYDTLPYTVTVPTPGTSPSIPGAFCRPLPIADRPEPPGLTPSELAAWRFSRDPTLSQQEFFNPDTFQIICAGLDEQFGTDDDLSNFWPGTRKDYLDSLKP